MSDVIRTRQTSANVPPGTLVCLRHMSLWQTAVSAHDTYVHCFGPETYQNVLLPHCLAFSEVSITGLLCFRSLAQRCRGGWIVDSESCPCFSFNTIHENLGSSSGTCIYWDEYSCLSTPKSQAFDTLKRGIERALELAYIQCRHRKAFLSLLEVQGPPANRAIWQRRFTIFTLSGEGEWCCQVAWP